MVSEYGERVEAFAQWIRLVSWTGNEVYKACDSPAHLCFPAQGSVV